MIYTNKNKEWKDNANASVPLRYIGKLDRFKEKAAGTLLNDAKALNRKLKEYKEKMKSLCDEAYRMALESANQDSDKERKGNYTFFSFDRSVRIEVSINEKIEFESVNINAAKEKLEAYLSEKLSAIKEGLREVLTDAFKTRNSQLDPKRVLSLLSYRNKVNSKRYDEVCELIEKSIIRTYSATYYRIAERNAEGKYEYIDLNFSSI